jgi:hypothetical protein
METVTISRNIDWAELRERKLMTIVDPMVYRTADLFLSGRSPSEYDDTSANRVWETISKNVGALTSFFDSIILREKLPIFSYSDTFRENNLLNLNREHDFLVPVVVQGEVYKQSKASALKELRSSKPIPQQLAEDLLSEMEVFGYDWQPGLDELGQLSPDKQRLQLFLLGGLIFGGYAQQMSISHGTAEQQAEHVLQPKRSRLFLAASIGDNETTTDDRETTTDDALLLRRFKQISESLPADAMHTVELPPAPTFLPLLLRQNPATPRKLLELALEWRDKVAVRAFREWYRHIEVEAHRHYNPPELGTELLRLREDIAREQGQIEAESITVSANVGAALKVVPQPEIGAEAGVSVERQVDLGRVKWFFQSLLPGKSYRKLFVRMAIAQRGYADLTQHLGELWHRQEA